MKGRDKFLTAGFGKEATLWGMPWDTNVAKVWHRDNYSPSIQFGGDRIASFAGCFYKSHMAVGQLNQSTFGRD